MRPDFGADGAWPRQPGATGPAGWFRSADGEAAPPFRRDLEPARSDETPGPAAGARDDDQPQGPAPTLVPERPALWPWTFPGRPRHIPVVGPTQALTGRPGGPGLPVPPGAVPGPLDPGQRSGWQLAQRAWQESGARWEPDEPGPDASGQGSQRSAFAAESPPGVGPWPVQDGSQRPASGRVPLGAPVTAGPPRPAPHPGTPPLGDPDELFRAWQGSVRKAAAPRRAWPVPWQGRTVARRRMWRAVTIGVPAAVIVTVGIGALLMLTGRANEMLAVRAGTGTQSPGAASAARASGGPSGGAVPLAGYPGQHGTVTVGALASAAGASVAVGSADGHPAVWRRAGGGWTLESGPVLGAVPGTGNLTAVAHGPHGWIAVGSAAQGKTSTPLVITSADGVAWRPAASAERHAVPGVQFTGAAAGPRGYVVVGSQTSRGRTFAVLWWSPDLRTWTAGGNGGLDGRLLPSTADAAVATGSGFVAVGSHGAYQAIWTSADGRDWTLRNISAPSGAGRAVLRLVAADGTSVVAAGYAATGTGDIPVAMVLADGGTHWQQVVLPAPDGHGAVTALTAAGSGFVAAGLAGPPGAQHPVTWTSRDGITWPAPVPAASGTGQITALNAAGATVTGAARQGTAPSVVTLPYSRDQG